MKTPKKNYLQYEVQLTDTNLVKKEPTLKEKFGKILKQILNLISIYRF